MLFAAYPISYASADMKFEANERARPEGVQVVRQGPRKKSSHQNAEGKYHEECMGQIIQTRLTVDYRNENTLTLVIT